MLTATTANTEPTAASLTVLAFPASLLSSYTGWSSPTIRFLIQLLRTTLSKTEAPKISLHNQADSERNKMLKVPTLLETIGEQIFASMTTFS